jgi:hypothetical protein
MPSWFLKLIGVEGEIQSHAQVGVVRLDGMVLGIGLPLLVVLGYLIFRRLKNARVVSRRVVLLLTGTRVALLGLLLLILANPTLRVELNESRKPLLIVLVDQSQSMNLRWGEFTETEKRLFSGWKLSPEATRGEVAATGLKQLQAELFDPLRERFDLRFFGFAQQVEPLTFPLELKANGSQTQIGNALQKLNQDFASQSLAGIIIVSDGEQTAGSSLAEAAEQAKRLGVPLFTIPTGDQQRLRDLSLVEVSSSGEVGLGDSARIGAVIESHGYDKESVTVFLKEGEQILDQKTLVLSDREQQQVELRYPSKEPGTRYLTVEINLLPGERIDSNNREVTVLKVTEGKRKVLYLEGLPRWDFRYLKNGMSRDTGLEGVQGKKIDLILESEWRLLPERERQSRIPQTLEELTKYDLFIIGDVSPSLLSEPFLKLLDSAVREKGVGLLVQAGTQSMPHRYPKLLQSLLPISVQENRPGLEVPLGKSFTLELSREGESHETMRLHDEIEKNRTLWREMLSFSWCIASVKPAPGATVLAWNAGASTPFGKFPLIAWQFAGEGKVMLVGLDSTWLWRQNVGERFFYKFWGQSIRFTARKEEERNRTRINITPPRLQPGDEAMIELFAFNEKGDPLSNGRVKITRENTEQELDLVADPQRKGRFTGRVQLPEAGSYRFQSNGVEARVQVRASNEELRHPNVNRSALRTLAEMTGGKMIELSDPELSRTLLTSLKGEAKRLNRSLEATLWDNLLMLVLFVGIFCFEIAVRRLSGLA